jgi:hypothetical protein
LKGYSEQNMQVSSMVQNRLFYQTVKVYFEWSHVLSKWPFG